MYTVAHVCELHGVVQETVRQWVMEFEQYLSPTANPGKNKKRHFTVEDMRVLSLIAKMKDQSFTYEEIHAALQNGQRGDSPELDPDRLQLIATSERENHLSLQIAHLKDHITQMETSLQRAQEQLQELDQYKERATTQAVTITHLERERGTLEAQLKEARIKIEELARQIGEAYGKGYIAGFKESRE